MENLCDLFFELSNEDRLLILLQLEKKAMNATNLSKVLGLTIQECSRHLTRLGEVDLTQKEVDGLYRLSSYGELTLRQIQGVEFTSKHRDYFKTHTLSNLPTEFVCQIGELSKSTYVDNVMVTFHNIERMIREAEEYIWWIVDEYPVSTYPLEREAYERGIKIKCLEPKGWVPHPKLREGVLPKDIQAISKARNVGLLEERTLDQLDVFLYISEKEMPTLVFPTLDGRFDYLGFTSTDERAHKWCRDLFQYYWEKAEPRREFVYE